MALVLGLHASKASCMAAAALMHGSAHAKGPRDSFRRTEHTNPTASSTASASSGALPMQQQVSAWPAWAQAIGSRRGLSSAAAASVGTYSAAAKALRRHAALIMYEQAVAPTTATATPSAGCGLRALLGLDGSSGTAVAAVRRRSPQPGRRV
jgi:hypothetical protein